MLRRVLSQLRSQGAVSPRAEFSGSAAYWEDRYRSGGTSGAGSSGRLARFKADIVNGIVDEFDVQSVVEFGCGDGRQLLLADYPAYKGYDVSPTSVALCRQRFSADSTKTFDMLGNYDPAERFDLSLSLDVIFHLVEDHVYHAHMNALFSASDRLVLIYSSNQEEQGKRAPHVRHRRFMAWVSANAPNWELMRIVPNRYPAGGATKATSFSDFYLFQMKEPAGLVAQ